MMLTVVTVVGLVAVTLAFVVFHHSLSAANERAMALAAFETVHQVATSPRCLNCHRSDLPRIREDGRPHIPRVRPADDGAGRGGERCVICHRLENNPLTRIPGAQDWRMPPYLMSWDGLSAADICGNLKDPEINGGRTLDEVGHHFRHDHLVQWAWSPGADRRPPPVSFEKFINAANRWLAGGAPCPNGD